MSYFQILVLLSPVLLPALIGLLSLQSISATQADYQARFARRGLIGMAVVWLTGLPVLLITGL